METTAKTSVYSIVTEKIINRIQNGTIPWKTSWYLNGQPRNLISRNPYRGLNTILLGSAGQERNFFLSAKQAEAHGITIKDSEKPHIVLSWPMSEPIEGSEENGVVKRKMRYYEVYNISQCDNIPQELVPPVITIPENPIKGCELLLKKLKDSVEIKQKEGVATYDVALDCIFIPKVKSFRTKEEYYLQLFPLLIQSTGHEKRLNREETIKPGQFGSFSYALEELVAEVGACLLANIIGISNNSVVDQAYVKNWLPKLNNERLIFYASSRAQAAVDYLTNQKLS